MIEVTVTYKIDYFKVNNLRMFDAFRMNNHHLHRGVKYRQQPKGEVCIGEAEALSLSSLPLWQLLFCLLSILWV